MVSVTRPLSRRALFLVGGLGAGATLAACTQGPSGETTPTSFATSSTLSSSATSSSSSTASSSPTPDPTTTGSTSSRPLWLPDGNDVSPEVKLLAAQEVETTISQPVVEVVFAQYGGILTDTASVLVVTHPWPAVSDPATGSTYDVRLVRSGGAWRVSEIHPSIPGAATASPSTTAREVLGEPRISLPPAARADIASGQVHDSVLTAMLTMAQRFEIGVSVVRTGHPTYVFGTSRLSDHPRGRAFDTWRVDGQAVVSVATPRNLVVAYMQAAAAAGSYNVGGPYQLTGSTYFSDNTHHDHVHAGFTT